MPILYQNYFNNDDYFFLFLKLNDRTHTQHKNRTRRDMDSEPKQTPRNITTDAHGLLDLLISLQTEVAIMGNQLTALQKSVSFIRDKQNEQGVNQQVMEDMNSLMRSDIRDVTSGIGSLKNTQGTRLHMTQNDLSIAGLTAFAAEGIDVNIDTPWKHVFPLLPFNHTQEVYGYIFNNEDTMRTLVANAKKHHVDLNNLDAIRTYVTQSAWHRYRVVVQRDALLTVAVLLRSVFRGQHNRKE